jgi:UDP-N-acetylglucosamine 1-carboxyvinyltransferase
MGANIKIEGHSAVVLGVEKLCGATVRALDLRSGGACFSSFGSRTGPSLIHNLEMIDRGY